jgi:hypothetical protein
MKSFGKTIIERVHRVISIGIASHIFVLFNQDLSLINVDIEYDQVIVIK